MQLSFAGKVALVTGAGSGIGAATARALAREGAAVGVLSRTREEIERVAKEINEGGGQAIPLHADIGDQGQMRAAVELLVKEFGRLDVVVANAGINGPRAPFEEIPLDEFDEVTRINQRGTFITLQESVRHLKKNGGSIVVVSSVNGNVLFNDAGSVAYSATKAAQVAMVKVLAIELSDLHIRINAVLPGTIDTEIEDNTWRRRMDKIGGPEVKYPEGEIPLERKESGSPEEVAAAIMLLASDAAGHVTGTAITVDGGQSLVA